MLNTPQDYVDSLEGAGKEWLKTFLDYMHAHHEDIPPIMFRQRPMYKVGESYILFSVAKMHFTVHTLNFALIEQTKAALPRAQYGKGSVKVKFTDMDARPVLMALCDEVIRVNRLPNPPPVDTVPEQPYDEKLAKAFTGVKAKWLPLYEALRDMARATLPPFEEYFPAVNVLWKHGSTFAQVSAVAAAMRVEFYADAQTDAYGAMKVARQSSRRFAYTVEVTGASQLTKVLTWIAASYALTRQNQKKGGGQDE